MFLIYTIQQRFIKNQEIGYIYWIVISYVKKTTTINHQLLFFKQKLHFLNSCYESY